MATLDNASELVHVIFLVIYFMKAQQNMGENFTTRNE